MPYDTKFLHQIHQQTAYILINGKFLAWSLQGKNYDWSVTIRVHLEIMCNEIGLNATGRKLQLKSHYCNAAVMGPYEKILAFYCLNLEGS